MRPSVPTCAPDEPVREVLERMALTRAPRLPVVGADGDLHGLLSIDDIVLWAAPSGAVSCQDLLRTLRSLAVARLPAV
jgi:CBS domain-containing protein